MSKESKAQDSKSSSVSGGSKEEKGVTQKEAAPRRCGKLSEEDILKMFASDSSGSKTPSARNTPAAPNTSRLIQSETNHPGNSVGNAVAEEVVVRESKRCGGCEIS